MFNPESALKTETKLRVNTDMLKKASVCFENLNRKALLLGSFGVLFSCSKTCPSGM